MQQLETKVATSRAAAASGGETFSAGSKHAVSGRRLSCLPRVLFHAYNSRFPSTVASGHSLHTQSDSLRSRKDCFRPLDTATFRTSLQSFDSPCLVPLPEH